MDYKMLHERQKRGQYHYLKLESADEIREALSSKFRSVEEAIDPDHDIVAYLVETQHSFVDRDDLMVQLVKTQERIIELVSQAQKTEQILDVHVKDVYGMGLKADYDITIAAVLLNRSPV